PTSISHDPATTALYTLSLHDALPILTYSHSLPPRCGTLNGIFRSATTETSDAISLRTVSLEIVFHPRNRGRQAIVQRMRRLPAEDRKSTRLNSSHVKISYAVFCLKKK